MEPIAKILFSIWAVMVTSLLSANVALLLGAATNHSPRVIRILTPFRRVLTMLRLATHQQTRGW